MEGFFMFKCLTTIVLAGLLFFSSGCLLGRTPGVPVSIADITKGTVDTCVQSAVDLVSQKQYQKYHLSIENMGLGLYGGPGYNMGYRNRDIDGIDGSLGNREARLYLRNKFKDMGLEVSFQGQYSNVVAELKGTKTPEKVYIIGAHYDHLKGDRPGGDDNASGVAAILEAARVLSQYKFKSTIRFIGFNAEEDGLLGSYDYISNLPEDADIAGMVNLDMILRPGSNADPDAPIDVDVRTDGSVEWAKAYVQAMTDYVPSLKMGAFIDKADSWSDNDSFQRAGIRSFSVMAHPWEGLTDIIRVHPYVHRYGDASDRGANNPKDPGGVKYDFAFATNITRAIVAMIAQEAVVVTKPESE
jgi:hypothetical protein